MKNTIAWADGYRVYDYIDNFMEDVSVEDLNDLIKFYWIELWGVQVSDIKRLVLESFGVFASRGFNFNYFIETSIRREGKNIDHAFLRKYGVNLTVEQAVALWVLFYFYEDENSLLMRVVEWVRESAWDIVCNI